MAAEDPAAFAFYCVLRIVFPAMGPAAPGLLRGAAFVFPDLSKAHGADLPEGIQAPFEQHLHVPGPWHGDAHKARHGHGHAPVPAGASGSGAVRPGAPDHGPGACHRRLALAVHDPGTGAPDAGACGRLRQLRGEDGHRAGGIFLPALGICQAVLCVFYSKHAVSFPGFQKYLPDLRHRGIACAASCGLPGPGDGPDVFCGLCGYAVRGYGPGRLCAGGRRHVRRGRSRGLSALFPCPDQGGSLAGPLERHYQYRLSDRPFPLCHRHRRTGGHGAGAGDAQPDPHRGKGLYLFRHFRGNGGHHRHLPDPDLSWMLFADDADGLLHGHAVLQAGGSGAWSHLYLPGVPDHRRRDEIHPLHRRDSALCGLRRQLGDQLLSAVHGI